MHERVHDRLARLVSQAAADFLADACEVLEQEPPMRGLTHVVAHLAREVESSFRQVLGGLPGVSDTLDERTECGACGAVRAWQPGNHVEAVISLARRTSRRAARALAAVGEDVEGESTREAARNLTRRLRAALDAHIGGNTSDASDDAIAPRRCPKCGDELKPRHEHQLDEIFAHLGVPLSKKDIASMQWHGEAHRANLRAPRNATAESRAKWDRFVSLLDQALDALERKYADVLAEFEALRAVAAPTKENIAYVKAHLGHGSVAADYFFTGLPATWLPQLKKAGFFKSPPEPVVDAEAGTARYERWPQSRWLAAIASEAPAEVATAILSTPLTRNFFIHVDFLLAASKMPGPFAAKVAQHELAWVKSETSLSTLASARGRELADHLLEQEMTDAAERLLRALLGFVTPEPTADSSASPWANRPRPRMSDWEYDRVVRTLLPRMATTDRPRTWKVLADLLRDGPRGRSSLWRKAIEDHQQNGRREPLDSLIEVLRTLAEEDVSTKTRSLGDVVSELERFDLPVFDRLALHLIGKFGAAAPTLVAERASNTTLLEDIERYHEFAVMMRDRFGDLDDVQRDRVLSAIRSHTTPERLAERIGDGNAADEEQLDQEARRLRFRWFKLIEGHLDDTALEELTRLQAEFTAPSHPTFLSWTSGWESGNRTPQTPDQLLGLRNEALLGFLREWEPSGDDFMGPSRSGLATSLRTAVSRDPVRFFEIADRFVGLHREYVFSLVWGLHDVAKRGPEDLAKEDPGPPIRLEEWEPAIRLVEWVAQQHGEEERLQLGWSEARRMAVDLAEDTTLFTDSLDPELIARAWAVVSLLLEDADPSPERVASNEQDPATLAINSVRGQALHAAVTFAQRIAALRDETAAALEQRSLISKEPSVAVRSVLAHRLYDLFRIDKALASAVADALFPDPEDVDEASLSAFSEFIRWNPSSGPGYALAKGGYEGAVSALDSLKDSIVNRLGSHLIFLAAHGVIDFREKGGLLERFVKTSSIEARKHALESLGRGLRRTDTLDPSATERVRELWSWWRRTVTATGDSSDLAAMGWWFTSDVFDDVWVLEQLGETLAATNGAIDWDHEVAKKLASLAGTHGPAVIGPLEQFVTGGDEWRVPRTKDAVHDALEVLLGNDATREPAREIVQRLLARGWREFSDLL